MLVGDEIGSAGFEELPSLVSGEEPASLHSDPHSSASTAAAKTWGMSRRTLEGKREAGPDASRCNR